MRSKVRWRTYATTGDIGATLIGADLYVVIKSAVFTKEKTVLKAGPIEANVQEQQGVPSWAEAVAMVAGIGCITGDVRKV